jgi:glycosyltransferase involved in cell wall biosynthesis
LGIQGNSVEHVAAQKIRITVGIASYNRPELLKRAIQSALSQSYSNLEILISDNGSTKPEVREVIEVFAASDSRIRCIFHPVNQGAFFNFRSVLSEAGGDFFVWLADDDYWSPEYLANLLAAANETGAVLTYGRAEIVDIEIAEKDRFVKEMATETGPITSMLNFVRFDTDAIFYGLFPTKIGQKLGGLLRNWTVPKTMARNYPFLEYNFVSYVFIFGLLSVGRFCNAGTDKAIHYAGGRTVFCPSPRLGPRHLALFLMYVLIHVQMFARFLHASLLVGSVQGLLVSPFAVLYLFVRRICMIVFQRFNRLIKG